MKKTIRIASLLLAVVLIAGLITMISGCSSTTTMTSTAVVTSTNTATSTSTSTQTSTTTKVVNREIIMASTTSTRDSGLMDQLKPIFQDQTGYLLKDVYVGSGAAITMGKEGNADVLLVHAPSLEKPFMDGGYGVNRRLVMHNYYLIVGPPSDPAGIKGMTVAVDAMEKMLAAGVTFYSRGDNSGTDVLEKSLWAKVGVTVKDNSTDNPSWYIEGGTGTGMLDLLRIASEKQAYTITDFSTYLFNKDKVSLDILVQGDPILINIYHVIQVNPEKWSKVNADGALAFSDFMVSAETQAFIAKYGVDTYGQSLFFADAGKTEAELGSY